MNWPFKRHDTDTKPTSEPTEVDTVDLSGYCQMIEVQKPVAEVNEPFEPKLIKPEDYAKVAEIPLSFPRPIIRSSPPRHQHTPHEVPKTGERTDIQMPSGAKRYDA